MTDKEKLEAWEQAYLSLYKFGHIGRVFEGTVHNLNGVVQAFSMQSELFELMFSKFRKQLKPLLAEPLSVASIEALHSVLKLVDKREKMLVPMADKIAYSQEIIKNTENICQRSHGSESLSLQALLCNVIGFYQSDMYFKHKVKVSFDVEINYNVDSICAELALVFQNIIQNAIAALVLGGAKQPIVSISFDDDDAQIYIHIRDNGSGVDAKVQDTLFEPFVSGWDDQPGLGLYFCKQICNEIGCAIQYERTDDWTDFTVTIPK